MKFEKLGNVFPIIRNGANIKQDKVTDGYPITRIETIADGTIDLSRVGYASIHDETFSDFYLQENDILMSHINSVSHLGKVALVSRINEKVIHGMNLLCLKADESKVHPTYSFYFFKSPIFRSKIKRITKKSVNQASFNISNLKDLEIPLPPLPDQLHIANLLSKAETLIAQRKESICLLDEFLKSTFLEMFGSMNEKNFPLERLDDVSTKINDGEHGSVEKTESGVLYLMARNITHNNTMDFKEISYVSKEAHDKMYKRCNPEAGDILIVCVGATIGKVAIVPKMEEFSIARSVALVKPNYKYVNSQYLLGFFNSEYAKRQIKKSSLAAAQAGLYIGKIKEIKIPVPPIELQTQFAKIVEKTEALKTQYQQSLQELENLYGCLSQKAFKGELSIKDESLLMAAEPGRSMAAEPEITYNKK